MQPPPEVGDGAPRGGRIGTDRERHIVVRGVGKVFRPKTGSVVVALSGIDLDVFVGEFVSLVGQSGCGKSTLLNMVGGLITPSAGVIQVRGETVESPRDDVGYMLQVPVLLPWRTVLENVLLPYEIKQRYYNRDAVLTRALDLLELAGLEEFRDGLPKELSGGMQQRAALVRTLTYEPRVLLMDEPFSALDEFTREALNLELLRLWDGSGITVVYVTHNIAEAVFLSDRVVVMTPRPGRIAEVIDVPVPRPRHPDHMFAPVFTDTVRRIRNALMTRDGRSGR